MSKIQEKILLLRIQHQRDADSFAKLYELLAEPIYRFIYFKVSDDETAKDLTSEVFTKCWRELVAAEGKQIKHLKAYLYRMARNMVVDHYRKKEVIVVSQEFVLSTDAQPHDDQGMKQVQQKIDGQKMLALMHALKSSYQEILLLRYVEDLSLTEIAHIIQKSPVSTRVLLHRANQALKREYEKLA